MFTEITIETAAKTLENSVRNDILGIEQKIMITDDKNEDGYFLKKDGNWFLKFPFFCGMPIFESWAKAVIECADESREFYYV